MKNWLEELLTCTEEAQSEEQIFAGIQSKAQTLGFAYCTYVFSAPIPLSNPRVIQLNNYPPAWRARYAAAGYWLSHPCVRQARQSQAPLVWSEPLLQGCPQLWNEAQSQAWFYGWAQSSLDGLGGGGMLTVARGAEPLSARELVSRQTQLRWLVQVAHLRLAPAIRASLRQKSGIRLTAREVEVLKWTADGKSAQDVADILEVSTNTVGFHIKNAMAKLQSCNKTASVVQAALLGYLS